MAYRIKATLPDSAADNSIEWSILTASSLFPHQTIRRTWPFAAEGDCACARAATVSLVVLVQSHWWLIATTCTCASTSRMTSTHALLLMMASGLWCFAAQAHSISTIKYCHVTSMCSWRYHSNVYILTVTRTALVASESHKGTLILTVRTRLSYRRGTARRAMLANSCSAMFHAVWELRNVSNSKSDIEDHSTALAMVPFDRPHAISY